MKCQPECSSLISSLLQLGGGHFIEIVPSTEETERSIGERKMCCSEKDNNAKRIQKEIGCNLELYIEYFNIYHTQKNYSINLIKFIFIFPVILQN